MTANHYTLTVWEKNGITLLPNMPQGFSNEDRARGAYHHHRNEGRPCRLEYVTVLEESEGTL